MGLFLKSHFEDHPLFIKYLNPLVLASFSIQCFLWLFVNVALYNEGIAIIDIYNGPKS